MASEPHPPDGPARTTEFVSAVSHEMRTPLTAIKGYVDLLLDGDIGPVPDEQREILEIVRQNSARLIKFIGDLTELTRLESGVLELRRVPVDLAEVIRAVAAEYSPRLEESGQRVVVEIPPTLPNVLADPVRVRQIVANLVSNANNFTPSGGEIRLTAGSAGGIVTVDVIDTGVGLSTDDQQRLFTRFFRARNPLVEGTGGSGLGLAIVRSLVTLQGGEIACTSSPGAGSKFSFSLPAAPEQEARS